MNINPFILFVSNIISLYNYALFAWIIISWLIYFNIVNTQQPAIIKINHFLNQIIEPALIKIRKFLPTIYGADLSPIVLILILQLLNNILFTYFYK
jgi:YggT family protein